MSHYAVSIEDEIVKKFCDACKKYQIMAVPNLYLREVHGTYDASILIDRNGEVLGIQKMVHVAQAEQFFEQDYYTPSDDTEQIVYVDIDLEKSGKIREKRPYTQLRRKEFYV